MIDKFATASIRYIDNRNAPMLFERELFLEERVKCLQAALKEQQAISEALAADLIRMERFVNR